MGTPFHFVDQIVAGKTNWKLKVRVTNLWTVQNKKDGQDEKQIEMLLLDEKVFKSLTNMTFIKSETHFIGFYYIYFFSTAWSYYGSSGKILGHSVFSPA